MQAVARMRISATACFFRAVRLRYERRDAERKRQYDSDYERAQRMPRHQHEAAETAPVGNALRTLPRA